jgi:ubiquinone/menaquinone biosynthesis C-methylase UbiE
MKEVLGDTLRPGGFSLTDIGVQYCNLSTGDTVLDLGCGRGATVNYLYQKYGITTVGIDPSEKLIEEAKVNYPYASFFLGNGEQLPFEDESFDAVFAECTLSLMDHPDRVMEQVNRVLKENGWFFITDVYAKNPETVIKTGHYSINSCMRGLHDLDELGGKLEQAGFIIVILGDYSQYLKELFVKISFSSSSMCEFWNAAADGAVSGDEFNKMIKQGKPGYFLMVARKD